MTKARSTKAAKALSAAHNQALDAADPTIGSVTMCDGQIFRGQAVDGKDVRGASAHGEHTFLVSLVRHDHTHVLRQAAVDRKTHEITAVPDLLAGRNLTGVVTTMDALLTQQRIAPQILAQGGRYLMIVKQNQPRSMKRSHCCFGSPRYLCAVVNCGPPKPRTKITAAWNAARSRVQLPWRAI